jgi:hypothetical protein
MRCRNLIVIAMSNILKFIRPHSTFDPDTLTILGDVYDRACVRFCSCQSSPDCDEMANRIFAAAMNGERDPDILWQIAVRGIKPPPEKGACT